MSEDNVTSNKSGASVAHDEGSAQERSAEQRSLAASQRDVPISTLVRMMGLPTKGDILVIEQKIDALMTKVNNISNRLDRISSNFEHGSEFDRLDVQLSDIRTTLKEILPRAVAQLSQSGIRPAVMNKQDVED